MNVRVVLPTLLVVGIITGALAVYGVTPFFVSTTTSTQTETQLATTTLNHTITDTSTVLSTQKATVTSTDTTTAFATQTKTTTAYSTQTVVTSTISTTTATSTSTSTFTVTSILQTATVTETTTQTSTVSVTDLLPGPDLMTFSGSGNSTSYPFSADKFNLFIETSVNASNPLQNAVINWYMYAVNGNALVGEGNSDMLGRSTSWVFGVTPGDTYYVKVVATNAIWSLTVSGEMVV